MLNAKSILTMVGLYLIFTGIVKYMNLPLDTSKKSEVSLKDKDITNYPTFTQPLMAKKILEKLYVKPELTVDHYTPWMQNFSLPFFGYIPDNDYCNKRLDHFVHHTDTVFKTPVIFAPEAKDTMRKEQILHHIGEIVDPEIREPLVSRNREKNTHYIKKNVTLFTVRSSMFRRREFAKQFSCFSQVSNRIPGELHLALKNMVAERTNEYEARFKDKPQCFNHESLFPKTYVLYNKEDCKNFFDVLNSPEYAEKKKTQRVNYIRKVGAGSHKGQGVFVVNEEEEANLKKTYENGNKCGVNKANMIIQTLIHDALLINDFYKFDFRVFMFIISTNPIIGYYNDGYLRISLIPYNSSDTENETKMMLTNLMVNKEIYDNAKKGILYNGMDEEGLRNAQQGTVESLGPYLLKKGIVTDPDWVQNYLRKEMKKAMIHLTRMAEDRFLKDSGLFQLFGIDFILDKDLKLWFIEANDGPALPPYSKSVNEFMAGVLITEYQMIMALLRARMKRVVNFVNELIPKVTKNSDGSINIPNFEQVKADFEKINRNYFEGEYQPPADSKWQPFIDENLEGTDKYFGLVPPECL